VSSASVESNADENSLLQGKSSVPSIGLKESALPVSQAPQMKNEINLKTLANLEARFSHGMDRNVPCARGRICSGADRMNRDHKYGQCYADVLNQKRAKWLESGLELVVGEVGILRGSGLAIWSRVFPNSEIDGFDFMTSNTKDNLPFLKSEGAFQQGDPFLHTFDQLEVLDKNVHSLHDILGDKRMAFVVDDGLHTLQAITGTFLAFKDFMRHDGVYVVEDWLGNQEELSSAVELDGWTLHPCKYDKQWYWLEPPQQ